MGLYVVAIVDPPVTTLTLAGRTYHGLRVASLCAVVETRSASPAPEDPELRHQFAVVTRLGRECDAVLPLRFGALMARAELRTLLTEHERTLRDALDDVRHRVQMTVRFIGVPAAATPAAVSSGREYLRRRASAVRDRLTTDAARTLARLDAVAASVRLAPGAGTLLATAYHLVPREALPRYREAAEQASAIGAVVSGPIPPFAFTPGVLR